MTTKRPKKKVHPINISHKTLNLPKAVESDASPFENVKLSEKVKFTITIQGYQILQFGDFLKGIGGHCLALGQWLQWSDKGPAIVVQEMHIEKHGSEDNNTNTTTEERDPALKTWQCNNCGFITYCEYDPSYDIRCKNCKSQSWQEVEEYEK